MKKDQNISNENFPGYFLLNILAEKIHSSWICPFNLGFGCHLGPAAGQHPKENPKTNFLKPLNQLLMFGEIPCFCERISLRVSSTALAGRRCGQQPRLRQCSGHRPQGLVGGEGEGGKGTLHFPYVICQQHLEDGGASASQAETESEGFFGGRGGVRTHPPTGGGRGTHLGGLNLGSKTFWALRTENRRKNPAAHPPAGGGGWLSRDPPTDPPPPVTKLLKISGSFPPKPSRQSHHIDRGH